MYPLIQLRGEKVCESKMSQPGFQTRSLDPKKNASSYSPALNLPVPIYTPRWREALWESSVLPRILARARHRAAHFGDERTNREATLRPLRLHAL